jgi:hypothetical protein
MLLTLFLIRESFRARIEQMAQRTKLSHALVQDIYKYATFATSLTSPTVQKCLLSDGSIAESPEQLNLRFGAQQAVMLDGMDSLLQGTSNGPMQDVTTTALPRDSDVGQLMLFDACDFFQPYVPNFGSVQACRLQRNSVLRQGGLQGGILELVSIVRRGFGSSVKLLAPVRSAEAVYLLQTSALNDSISAANLLLPYIAALSATAVEQQEAQLMALGDTEFSFLVAASVFFLFLLLLTVVFVFIPFAKRIGEHATAAQVVLALLPTGLIAASLDLQEAVNKSTRKVIIGSAGREAARKGIMVD